MRKFTVFLGLLSVLLFSCDSKPLPSLWGTWEAQLTLKTELSDGNPDSLPIFLYTKQHITLAFAEDGVYTRKIVQTVDRVESMGTVDEAQDAKEYFSQFFNKNLAFDGEYQQEKNTVYFMVNTVQENDGEILPYEQFFMNDPSIGDGELSVMYELKDDGILLLDGVTYKKVD